MRELRVLGNGHLKLDFAEWKEFFEIETLSNRAVSSKRCNSGSLTDKRC